VLIENPKSAKAVIKTLTATILPEPNFLFSLSLKKLEMIVPTEIIIEIMPAKDTGTLILSCKTGQAEPRSESGNPRLINAKYIITKSKLAINISFKKCFLNYIICKIKKQ
jgi:hypothetical protein